MGIAHSLQRRAFLAAALLLFGILMAGTGRAADLSDREKELLPAAQKEGEVAWYVSHYETEVAEQVGRAFEARYPGVKLNILRTTAQVAFQRVSAELKSDAIQCDVLGSSDPSHYVYLKQRDALLKYVPANDAKIVQAFRAYDKDGFFHVTFTGLLGIAYNKEKVTEAEAPKSWKDLLDPKWKNRIGSGHPGFSGSVGVWVITMGQLHGPTYLKQFEAQKPQIGRSINDTQTMLSSGERQVAVVLMQTIARAAERGNPLGLVYPSDGAVLIVGPSGIIKGSRHPNAAKLLMEFLQSVEMAELGRKVFVEPIRPEVGAAPGMRSLATVKLAQPTIDEIEKGIPVVKEEWRELFGN
jgi:iron(III) transport system substrate-binding protein